MSSRRLPVSYATEGPRLRCSFLKSTPRQGRVLQSCSLFLLVADLSLPVGTGKVEAVAVSTQYQLSRQHLSS